MEDNIKRSINALSATIGIVIALQGLNINFIYSLAASLVCIIAASNLFSSYIKTAINDGVLSKKDLQSAVFKSPYIWVGVAVFVVLVVFV